MKKKLFTLLIVFCVLECCHAGSLEKEKLIIQNFIKSVQKNDLNAVARCADIIAICTDKKQSWSLEGLISHLNSFDLDNFVFEEQSQILEEDIITIRVLAKNGFWTEFGIGRKYLKKGLDKPTLSIRIIYVRFA